MGSSSVAKTPSRKDLVIFAAVLPLFMALLGWLSVPPAGRDAGRADHLRLAAIIGTLTGGKEWKTRAWSLFIPAVLLAFLIMGSANSSAAFAGRLAGGWAVVGATIGVMVLLAPRGDAIYTFWLESAEPIGLVISAIVLGAAFYLVFTPIGWIMRIVRNDPMA